MFLMYKVFRRLTPVTCICIMLCWITLLVSLVQGQTLHHEGPFFFPTGETSDPIYIIFGEHNTTHFFLNMFVTGAYWFGFGFASGSGCTNASAEADECYMKDTEALVFGDYASADPTKRFTAKEFILGKTDFPHSPEQEISQNYLEVDEVTQQCFGGTCDYTVRIRRPYDPSAYGDRNAYQITYPLAGSFCFLWAQGNGIFFSPSSTHENNGAKCIAFGGTTVAPTPTPSYNPIPNPTIDPTPKPTGNPSVQGDTGTPTTDPTTAPTTDPTDISNAPSVDPTQSPTPGPTVEAGVPTKSPTLKPTTAPTDEPTSNPTPLPSESPTKTGDTRPPTTDPTTDPTSLSPTGAPTVSPTAEPTTTTRTVVEPEQVGTDNTWLEENLEWIIIVAAVAVIVCFVCALCIFWYSQKRRHAKRKEKRQNMLNAEKFKLEQGLNIDAETKAEANKAAAAKRAKKNKKKRKKRRRSSDEDDESGEEEEAITGKKGRSSESDEDEEEEEQYTVRVTGASARKGRKSTDEDSDEESEEKPKRKPRRKPAGRAKRGAGKRGRRPKRSKFATGNDDDEENKDSEEEDEERPRGGRRKKGRPRRRKKRPRREEPSEDEEDEDESD
eukprot:983509_1